MSTYGLAVAGPDDSLELAARIMAWADVVHLPVVDSGGKVLGVLSARDLLGAQSRAARVDSFMTAPAVTVSPDEELDLAAMAMVARRVGCLPVVEEGVLVGILTTGDVLAHQVSATLHERLAGAPATATFLGGEVMTCHPADSLVAIAARMTERGVRHVPVVDRDRRLVGMLSDRDVRAALGSPAAGRERGGPSQARLQLLAVEDAMSRRPISATAAASLLEIARTLTEQRVGAVPLVDDEQRLVGMLSYADLLRAAGG